MLEACAAAAARWQGGEGGGDAKAGSNQPAAAPWRRHPATTTKEVHRYLVAPRRRPQRAEECVLHGVGDDVPRDKEEATNN